MFYVGHSEGTTQAFSGFEDADVASQVKLFVALAPVAYVGDSTSLLFNLLADFHVDTALTLLGFNTFLEQHCWLDTFLDGKSHLHVGCHPRSSCLTPLVATCDIANGDICQISMCALAGCSRL